MKPGPQDGETTMDDSESPRGTESEHDSVDDPEDEEFDEEDDTIEEEDDEESE